MKKALIALAFGTFGLGINEFVMMGILPHVAHDFGISIPSAGHFISAYALGVCIGAPIIALFFRSWPLKRLLYLLMGIFVIAGLGMSLCPTKHSWLMIICRMMAGLPHGAYFGVGSIVASRLAPQGKHTFAVAIMCSGMTVANLIGIPFGTFLSSLFSWRLVFGLSALWGVFTLVGITRWVPTMEALPRTNVKEQFRFLSSPAPWLIIACTLFGNGGVFCYYSYVSPLLTQISGVPTNLMSLIMILAGAGMVTGNLFGGHLSDHIGPGHTGKWLEYAIGATLLLIFAFSSYTWVAILLMFIATFCLFGVSSPQQLLLLKFSKGGELMGGAMVQLAFNLGNAIGAYAGGIPPNLGKPYNYCALVGCGFALIGIICYEIFCHKYEMEKAHR